MNKLTIEVFSLLMVLLLFPLGTTHGQETSNIQPTQQFIKVKKRTVMERYEPKMILSVEDRVRLKEERLATIKKRREIIDTLSISERRRRRLLKELYRTPNSDRWEKAIADMEFVDDELEDPQ